MAYVPRDDEDEEQTQQPMLGGGMPTMSPTGATSGAPVPQQKPQQQRGTGFVNLQSWLDAGRGRDKSITSAGQNLIGQEQQAFNKAADPLRTADYKAKTVEDVNKGQGARGTNYDIFGENLWDAANGNTGKKSEIKGMLEQDYQGPTSVDYDARGQKNLWDADALTSADTVGSVLGRKEAEAGRYGAGMQALDRVLYGADAASRKASEQVGKDLGTFTGNVGTEKQKLADKAQGFKDVAAKAREGTRAELIRQGKGMNEGLDSLVAQAQSDEASARNALQQGYVYNPATGKMEKLGGPLSAGQTTGGGATRENMVTDERKRGFDLLNELIGTPTVQKSGAYQPLRTEIVRDPNYDKPLPGPKLSMDEIGNAATMLPEEARREWLQNYMTPLGNTISAVQMQDAYERFQRDHPEIKWPDSQTIADSMARWKNDQKAFGREHQSRLRETAQGKLDQMKESLRMREDPGLRILIAAFEEQLKKNPAYG